MKRERAVAILLALLEAEGFPAWPGGPENCVVRRTYAGHWQRSAGAWSWFLWTRDGSQPPFEAGSQWPLHKVLAARPKPYAAEHGVEFDV